MDKKFVLVHLNLLKSQRDWLKRRFPTSGYGKAIREIVARFIRETEAQEEEATSEAASHLSLEIDDE